MTRSIHRAEDLKEFSAAVEAEIAKLPHDEAAQLRALFGSPHPRATGCAAAHHELPPPLVLVRALRRLRALSLLTDCNGWDEV